jgi:hypothetical protein
VDCLTGEVLVLRADIVCEYGTSLNPAVDIGQVEGAFVMGIGYLLTEEVVIDKKGKQRTRGTWEYKVCRHTLCTGLYVCMYACILRLMYISFPVTFTLHDTLYQLTTQPPTTKDIPVTLNTTLLKNEANPLGMCVKMKNTLTHSHTLSQKITHSHTHRLYGKQSHWRAPFDDERVCVLRGEASRRCVRAWKGR